MSQKYISYPTFNESENEKYIMCTVEYMLYTHKPQLTRMGESLIHNDSCRRQWLKESCRHRVSVVEDLSSVHGDVTFSTEVGVRTTVTATDSSWIAPTLLADECGHIFLWNNCVYKMGSLCPPALWQGRLASAPVGGSLRCSYNFLISSITQRVLEILKKTFCWNSMEYSKTIQYNTIAKVYCMDWLWQWKV